MTIIIPLIFGVIYFIILPIARKIETEISSIVIDGKIYKNSITNLLPFIFIFIIRIILSIKNKKKENPKFGEILFILSIIFVIILLIGNKLGIVSQYYFFKSYYIIWPLVIINSYIALSEILNDKSKILKIATYTYTGIYLITILTTTLIFRKNIVINDIFYCNAEYIRGGTFLIANEELKVLENIEDKIKRNQVYILTPNEINRVKWLAVLHENENIYNEHKYLEKLTIDKWINQTEKRYYLAYYRDYNQLETKQNMPDENNIKYKIIYNDEYTFILERK